MKQKEQFYRQSEIKVFPFHDSLKLILLCRRIGVFCSFEMFTKATIFHTKKICELYYFFSMGSVATCGDFLCFSFRLVISKKCGEFGEFFFDNFFD